MPESKKSATARAKQLGYPKSNVVKSSKGGYFIAPRGTTAKGKRIYAGLRGRGMPASKAAPIAIAQGKKKSK